MRRTTVLVVVIIAVLVVGSCTPTRSGYTGVAGAPRLNVVGHSIPTSARGELGSSLGAVHLVAFDTESGRTIPGAAPSLDWVVGEAPAVVVVDLGENELGTGQTQDQLRDLARQTLARLASVPCVVWVDMVEWASPIYRADWRVQAESFNAWLPTETAARAATHTAGWAARSRPHPEWFLADGLHLTTAGRSAYAEFITAEVDRFCGGPVATVPVGGAAPSPRSARG